MGEKRKSSPGINSTFLESSPSYMKKESSENPFWGFILLEKESKGSCRLREMKIWGYCEPDEKYREREQRALPRQSGQPGVQEGRRESDCTSLWVAPF